MLGTSGTIMWTEKTLPSLSLEEFKNRVKTIYPYMEGTTDIQSSKRYTN